jgi:IS4 transposase
MLRREESQRDSDYSGGGFYYESRKTLFLFADGTFRYEQHSSSRVSSGGLSQPVQRDTTDHGTWKVGMVDGKPILGLLDKSGELVEWWRAALGGGRHRQLLDDTPWDCLPIKD